jgi:ribonuclease P protein component
VLNAALRLTRKKDFDAVYKKGRTISTALFSFRFLENNRKTTRFAFVVAARTQKLATQRNTTKRRLRSVVATLIPGVKPGFDIVITARPGISTAATPELHASIIAALRRGKLLSAADQ